MHDKYITYVYTCLKRGKLQLVDKELSHLFGPNNTVFPKLDPIWMARFLTRCRMLYDDYVSKHMRSSSSVLSSDGLLLYVVRTSRSTRTVADDRGRIVRLHNFADPYETRELSCEECARFEESTVLFDNAAFVKRADRAVLSLVLCDGSHRSLHEPSVGISWDAYFTVKEKDIRGLEMDSEFVYTADGVCLYMMVASWNTSVCLVFDSSCRTDTIRTLCALALGDPELGSAFTLPCNIPEGVRDLDLRRIQPLRAANKTLVKPNIGHVDQCQRGDASSVQRGLMCLEEMVRVPAGFSIVAENELVVVLRHILRDVVIVVPKDTCLETNRTADCPDSVIPEGCVTEWFSCNYSSFVIRRGVTGVPPLAIPTAQMSGDAPTCTNGASAKVATLRLFPATSSNRVAPTTRRGFCGYAFDHAVCLLPSSMSIVTQKRLEIPSCIAIMYSILAFRGLTLNDNTELSNTPTGLLFAWNVELDEAKVIMAT